MHLHISFKRKFHTTQRKRLRLTRNELWFQRNSMSCAPRIHLYTSARMNRTTINVARYKANILGRGTLATVATEKPF